MTLVLACLTRNVIYQISDRRLTRLAHPHDPLDDEANKSIVVDGRVVFGYTGLAQIGTEPTDLWLTSVLARGPSNDMAQVAERVRDAATNAFRGLRGNARYKRQAFQGVGWFRLRGETKFTPGIVVVDNAIDHQTGGWLPAAKDEFQVVFQFPEDLPGSCILHSVGLTPSSGEKSAIRRLVRKCVKHRTATPRTVIKALVIAMRWLSSRYEPNSPIGRGLMAVSLPRRCVELSEQSGDKLLLAGSPDDATATFLYLSATGSTTYFGPHAVCDRSAVTGFEAGSL